MDAACRVRAHRPVRAGTLVSAVLLSLIAAFSGADLRAASATEPVTPSPVSSPSPAATPTVPPSAAPSPDLAPDLAPAPTPSRITVRLSRTSAPIGRQVLLRGTLTGGSRQVLLQTRDSRGRWRALERRTSRRDGTFVFSTPVWNRTHPLRVRALATSTAAETTSRVVTLTRFVPHSTGGRTTSWVPLGLRGLTRWNPCVTHSVQINARFAPPWFGNEVRAALKDLHLYTGLNFAWSGATTQRSPDFLGRWRNADVTLLWADDDYDPRLGGAVVAIGGAWFKHGSRADGFVHLDRAAALSRAQWRLVIRHELAHVMGLGHSRDVKQRMHHHSSLGLAPASIGNRWGRGDIEGLKQVGAAHGCTD